MPLFQVIVLSMEVALIADTKVLQPPAYLVRPILMALILMALVTTEVEAVGTWPTGSEEPAQPDSDRVVEMSSSATFGVPLPGVRGGVKLRLPLTLHVTFPDGVTTLADAGVATAPTMVNEMRAAAAATRAVRRCAISCSQLVEHLGTMNWPRIGPLGTKRPPWDRHGSRRRGYPRVTVALFLPADNRNK